MAKLDLIINEITKDDATQFKQIYLCLQNLLNWSNNILTQIAVDYREVTDAGDASTANTSYEQIPNYIQSATVKNPVCQLNLNLQLKGSGYIGVIINGLLQTEIPFSNLSFSPVIHTFYYNLKVGKNTIELKWRSNAGTIIKANSTTNPGFNSLQVVSFNS